MSGTTKSYNAFDTIEIDLEKDDQISIRSTETGGYGRNVLLTSGPIQEAHLEKLRALNEDSIQALNDELSNLNNLAKITDVSEDYIIIEFENGDEIDLNKVLNVFENHLIKSSRLML